MKRFLKKRAFTLLEMMVVIMLIVVLMGVVFRMTRPATGMASESETLAAIQVIEALLEEFYAEYGQYPPVPLYSVGNVLGGEEQSAADVCSDKFQPTTFEYPTDQEGLSANNIGGYLRKNWDEAPLFTFGLLSFFVNQDDMIGADVMGKTLSTLFTTEGTQWRKYGDVTMHTAAESNERDKQAAKRFQPILDQYPKSSSVMYYAGEPYPRGAYKTYTAAFRDAWGNYFVYISPPPYQTYLFFSKGPDGRYDGSAPGDRTKPKNKDNIYGNRSNNR